MQQSSLTSGWLRVRLLWVTGGLMLLFLLAGAYVVRELASLSRAKAEEQLLETTRALSLVVDSEYVRYAAALRGLSTTPALDRRDWAEVDRLARALVAGPNEWIVVADRAGRQLVNTRLPIGADLPRSAWQPGILAQLDRGVPRACPLSQGLVVPRILCLDRPLLRNGRAELILSVVLRPERLQRIIDAQRIPNNRFATIVDSKGIVAWRNVNPQRFVGRPATPDMLQALAQKREGVKESRSLEGVPTVIAFARGSYGLNFLVAVPQSQIGAADYATARSGLAAAALLMALALLIAVLFGKRLSDAIARIAEAAEALRDRRAPRFTRTGIPEIDVVGRALCEAHELRRESDERFELATEGTGIGIYDLDLTQGRGRWSDRAFEVLGVAPTPDRIGSFETWNSVLHPDDRERILRLHEENAAARAVWRAEYRVIRGNTGETRWLETYGRFVEQPDGSVRSLGIVADVTERKQVELSLAESESRLRRSQEAGGIGSYEWDMQTGLGTQSDGMLRMVGLPPGQGYTLKDIIAPVLKEDMAQVMETVEAIQKGVPRRETNYRIRHPKTGAVRWIRDIGQLETDAAGKPHRWVGIIQDVTEKAEAEAALRHLNETLEAQVAERTEQLRQSQKLEGMGQLTGGVAHDFNNLLTPIIGSLDLLQRRGIGSEREQRLIEGALQSAERAKTLVQRLLSFARRQPLQAVPVELGELVHGMADLIGSTSGPRVKLVVDLDPKLPAVKADPNQIEMALLNLAVNARDAMPDGGQLTISAAGEAITAGHRSGLAPGRYVRLAVSDTGVGMDAETLARAIEPFFSTKGVGKGTGLGLSMVHGLAAQLGGALTIDSKPGLGTTVELWLPLARRRAAPAVLPEEPSSQPLARTVLLVDDDRLARISTAEMLADLGYAVVEAESAEDAWRLIEGGLNFDLLISDHLMPGLSGTELARRVRSRMADKQLLIISGYAEVEGIAPDLPRLVKPFRRTELAAALNAAPEPAPKPQPTR